MNVVVLGAGGQLGHILVEYLKSEDVNVKAITHKELHVDAKTSEKDYFEHLDYLLNDVLTNYKAPANHRAYVVNCIGATKPHFNDKTKLADNIFTNAVWPHILAEYCRTRGCKLIHITTDCVYQGRKENPADVGYGESGDYGYTEKDKHDAADEYGKSKSLGEPENAIVLRTSIIGTERGSSRFLISWVLGQAGKEVNGFTNHWWSGVTTLELAKRIYTLMEMNFRDHGIYHTYGPDITKEELVKEIAAAFKVELKVNPAAAPEACDRRLRTVKNLHAMIGQQNLEEKSHRTMLNELYEWTKDYIKVEPAQAKVDKNLERLKELEGKMQFNSRDATHLRYLIETCKNHPDRQDALIDVTLKVLETPSINNDEPRGADDILIRTLRRLKNKDIEWKDIL